MKRALETSVPAISESNPGNSPSLDPSLDSISVHLATKKPKIDSAKIIKEIHSLYSSLTADDKLIVFKSLILESSTSIVEELSYHLASKRCKDLIVSLPREISELIFCYLDLRSLVTCSSVSKTWYTIVNHSSRPWRLFAYREGILKYFDKQPFLKYFGDASDPLNFAGNSFKNAVQNYYQTRHSWLFEDPRSTTIIVGTEVLTDLKVTEDKIICSSDDMKIYIFDSKSGRLLNTLVGHEGGVWSFEVCGSSSNVLVSGSTDRSVRVWDISTGVCKHVFQGHTSTIRSLLVVNKPTGYYSEEQEDWTGNRLDIDDDFWIITGSRDGKINIWDLPMSQIGNDALIKNPLVHSFKGHEGSVRSISSQAGVVVTGSYDNTVRLWSLYSFECLHVLRGHQNRVYSVIYDHETKRVISGSMDSTIRIWSRIDGSCLAVLEGHIALVGLLKLVTINFIPSGWGDYKKTKRRASKKPIEMKVLISAAADSTAVVWDFEEMRIIRKLQEQNHAVSCFAVNSRMMVTGSLETVKLWDLERGEYVTTLIDDCTRAWKVFMDESRCIVAYQSGEASCIRILDYEHK